MRLHATEDAAEFATAAEGFLDAAPASRALLRGIVDSARRDPGAWGAPPGLWWVEDGGEVIGCAAWTPPFPLLVTSFPAAAAADLLASAEQRAGELGRELRHVFGPRPDAAAVADAWAARSGRPWSVQMAELLHEADALVEPPAPAGAPRQATLDDVEQWLAWLLDFEAESGAVGAAAEMRPMVERALSEGRCWFWDDPAGTPVSMVGHAPPLPDLARIGPAYTPPEHRGRGYARRLTWQVSRVLLDAGLQRCVLYTDAANPVSNSIYRQIGYRPIEEHAVLQLG